ncbi:MAG: tyrosine--tRNA ligase [Proteobacteria bacterium]|nr:tyrosine--tRNA ligase [Pseudomonadota bacterium]
MSTSDLIQELKLRGLINQTSDEAGLDDHLKGAARTVYCGFDPTAPSLHIGNLVPLFALRRFQLHGHRPLLLVGGATGMIGDPSHRSDERHLNDAQTVANWVTSIRSQAEQFLEFEGDAAARVVNNLDWTASMDVISFLRDIGKHFSVNAMIARDSVRSRLERDGDGITYTEFSYVLLQSMDFMHLAKQYDCTVQIGGSDQWGNIVSGMDLTRRALGKEAYALTVPLITKADGTKFGKTAGGAVWLDPAKTSPYSFYQFWLNTSDDDVVHFLNVFTFLDLGRIDDISRLVKQAPEKREGQELLASEVTRLVHGEESLISARAISQALFGGDLTSLGEKELEQLQLDGMDSTLVRGAVGLTAALAETGLAPSRGAARKLVQSNGVQVNGQIQNDIDRELDWSDALAGRFYLIRRGRKNWHLLVRENG